VTWAPKETQIAIFTQLGTDTTLVGLLGGTVAPGGDPKVYDFVPDNKSFPYVTLQILPWKDRGNHTDEGLECELQINVFHQPTTTNPVRGNKTVQAIQARIDELLHKQSFCIDGWNILGLRRTFVDILTDPDNVTKHGIQRFKLLVGGV